MKRTLLQSYAFVVCLLAAIVIAVALTISSWNVVKLSAPSFTISNHNYRCHLNDKEYKKCLSEEAIYSRKNDPETMPSEASLSDMRKNAYENLIKEERRGAQQSLVWTSIILLISITGFAAHWKIAKA